ncbi:transcription factor IIIB 90 kDa subunit-like [Aphidius gifuensis]|uniref:transcription factor IIIB 90 kDa subunit-like n=1 Tax=Aphidius gifuensis TaxID=684658 RepID=UPI001CDB7D25|nr:transcription factor IIIB 90 kDa subunit-like [Aphidius gifuensis]
MSGKKCTHCGSTDIDEDLSRGSIYCRNCGTVLEDQQLTSSTTFEDNAFGGTTVVGHFVSNGSTGGSNNFGGNNGYLNGRASHEKTEANAKSEIKFLCNQLGTKDNISDMAVNFYRQALSKNMTCGRNSNLNYAACIYIACRAEKDEILLIDISEHLQIDVYKLGKTYLHFTNELSISVPIFDPSLYIARYARELDFGNKIKDVISTASRLVRRMKKDNIHTGRRPSGLCGAAILIAARFHGFNRTPADIIKIVQVHESTLRKRLIEFGDTPSSTLTVDEFIDIDFEEEQDPPAFKAARKKDCERLKQLNQLDFDDLQHKIEQQLNEHSMSKNQKRKKKQTESNEEVDTNRFIEEITMNTINSCVSNKLSSLNDLSDSNEPVGLGPDVSAMGLASSLYDTSDKKINIDPFESTNGELDITGLDDDELDSYILSEKATDIKASTWTEINADYLEQMKEKEAQRLEDIKNGIPEKKKRKTGSRKKNQIPASSAGEAIEKMLQEKKISTKINYEVLKSLNTVVRNKDSQDKLDEVEVTPELIRPSNVCSIKISNKPAPTISSTTGSPEKDVKIESKIARKLSPKNQISFNNDGGGEEIDDYYEDNDEEAKPDDDDINRIFRNSVDESYDYDEYY